MLGIDDEEKEFIEALEAELEAAKAEQTAGTKKSVLAKPVLETVCTECKTPVDPFARGVRLMSKQQRTFRCQLCNCKCTMLSTMFISWPIDDFKRLSETQKIDFWNSTGTSRAELKQAVEEQVILTRIKSKWSESKGDFQPLSWYKNQGYDTSTFASDLESEWNNDMGYMTYRVSIHGGGERLQEELARTEITKLLRKQPGESTPKKLRTEPEAPPEETEGAGVAGWTAEGAGGYPEETGTTPPTSQSSTTTTSSSSSQRHKFKKGKKGKKEKKSRKYSKKERKKEKARLEKERKEKEKKDQAERKRKEAEAQRAELARAKAQAAEADKAWSWDWRPPAEYTYRSGWRPRGAPCYDVLGGRGGSRRGPPGP